MNRYGAGRAATKAELVKLRGEMAVAIEGLELLENKRDLLMREGMHQLKQAAMLRHELTQVWTRVVEMWRDCLQNEDDRRLAELAQEVEPLKMLQGDEKHWMGVHIASYEATRPRLQLLGAIFDCGVRPELVRGQLVRLVPDLVRLMNLETNVRRLSSALKRCQRQVNALKNVIIPDLRMQQKNIEQRLEEKERESLFQIKRLKARMQ